jgi:predicted DNA binding CopG/RHH family protein
MNLDEFEQDILDSVENDEWISKNNLETRLIELQAYLKKQRKKPISIRVNENDIYELKKKALENSIPYQSLIQILIHQFANNKIELKI